MSIEIYTRVRPKQANKDNEEDFFKIDPNNKTITIENPLKKANNLQKYIFNFHNIITTSNQVLHYIVEYL